MFEKYDEIEQKVIIHGEKIKSLEEFKEEHVEEHQEFIFQHKINTKKIEYIERGLLYVLGICASTLLYSFLKLVIK